MRFFITNYEKIDPVAKFFRDIQFFSCRISVEFLFMSMRRDTGEKVDENA